MSAEVHVVLGVCTYRRPQMLVRCLKSLQMLTIPENVNLRIVVADNECSDDIRRIVTGMGISYLAVPERGVSHVRNAMIEDALGGPLDWMIFVDDDQYANPDWLEMMFQSHRQEAVQVVKSAVVYVDSEGRAFRKPQSRWYRGEDCQHVGTGGVMFDAWLIKPEGLGLRFDDKFAISGGEDRYFFLTAYLAGVKLVRTPMAALFEEMVDTRTGPWARFRRKRDRAWLDSAQDAELLGQKAAIIRARKDLLGALPGVFEVLLGGLIFPLHRRSGFRKLDEGAKHIGRAWGTFRGLTTTKLPGTYENIDGY